MEEKYFTGAVVLKEWMLCPTGNTVLAVSGQVRVAEAKDLAGFSPARSESNWAAVVKGPTESITILGCQIRAIHRGPWPKAVNAYAME